MRLSIVIPCYNEEGNLPLVVGRLRQLVGTRKDIEIILVDNGSKDASAAVLAREITAADPIRVATVPVNKGYGNGILCGLSEASGDVLAWTHADMQTDPADVLTAFELFKAQSGDVVIKGRRQNRRALETFFTYGMQLVASAALGVVLDDVNAQPKLFCRSFYEKHIQGRAPLDFSLDLFLLYQAKTSGIPILTVPVVFAPRLHGEAKGGGSWKTRIKLVRRTFAYIFELRRTLAASRS